MISHSDPEVVVSELGDKVVGALVHAVRVAKHHLQEYRRQHPDWAAGNAPRTLASLIHDWMWTDLKQQLETLPHVNLVDRHPTREITVRVDSDQRLSYRLRMKLHHRDGRTSSYQTQSVIDFELQGVTPTFPGFGETRLEAGYEWDPETRNMGAPVISLRDGHDKIIWVHPLAGQGEVGDGTVTLPVTPGPTLPTLDVLSAGSDDQTGAERS